MAEVVSILWQVAGFVVALSILVCVHEYGHYWMARRLGVKVLRFSLGFGKPIKSFTSRDGVEWAIAGGVAAVIVVLAVVAQRKGWIDLTGKHAGGRSGGVAGLVGGVDEVFAPMKYEVSKIQEAQKEMPAPAPIPGDDDKNIFTGNGRVRIDLNGER